MAHDIKQLENHAREIRKDIIDMIADLGIGHIGGCLSIVDVLAVLYFDQMNIRPDKPRWEMRDRLVLSKGHGGPALYATLAHRGYFDRAQLFTLNRENTNLPSHCDRQKTIGVDMTTGSLGQGISAAIGIAIGLKIKKNNANVYCIIGDGESQEGQVWEAAMLAGNLKLANFIGFTDYNHMQIDGTVDEINSLDPLTDKWRSFGFDVYSINGHDVGAIAETIDLAKKTAGKPHMIILNTIKGKGAYFCEGQVSSHNMVVSREMAEKAINELYH
jgi:transketolase